MVVVPPEKDDDNDDEEETSGGIKVPVTADETAVPMIIADKV